MKNFLTNRALVGETPITRRDGGEQVRGYADASWDAMVDEGLFRKVVAEAERRSRKPRNKRRTQKDNAVVRPVCALCGAPYHLSQLKDEQGRERMYVHARVPKRARKGDPSDYRCKQYNVSAGEIEGKLKDLVLEQRGSEGYAEEVMALLNEKAEFGRRAATEIAELRQRIEELEKQHRATVKLQLQAASRGLETDSYFEEIEAIEQRRNAAEADLDEAQEYAKSHEHARERLIALLDETKDLDDAWGSASLEERRMLLEWWVLDVMIAVEPIPGMKRANNKTALVALRGSRAEDVAAFSWSDDGGERFRDPALVLPDPARGGLNIVSQIQVLSDGTVVAPYHLIIWPGVSSLRDGSPPRLLDGEVAVIRSPDGRRWEEPVRVGSMRKWGHADQERMLKGMGAGGLVVGPGPEGGERLHLVWLDVLDGWLQVVTAHSADGGRSWSEPVRVSRSGREANQGNPGIAVDGQGRVAVVWNDRRNDTSERCFQPYVAVSQNGGQTFDEEIPVSEAPVCPRGGRWMGGGDTQGIVGLPDGGFQLLWVGGAASPDQPFHLFSSRIVTQ